MGVLAAARERQLQHQSTVTLWLLPTYQCFDDKALTPLHLPTQMME